MDTISSATLTFHPPLPSGCATSIPITPITDPWVDSLTDGSAMPSYIFLVENFCLNSFCWDSSSPLTSCKITGLPAVLLELSLENIVLNSLVLKFNPNVSVSFLFPFSARNLESLTIASNISSRVVILLSSINFSNPLLSFKLFFTARGGFSLILTPLFSAILSACTHALKSLSALTVIVLLLSVSHTLTLDPWSLPNLLLFPESWATSIFNAFCLFFKGRLLTKGLKNLNTASLEKMASSPILVINKGTWPSYWGLAFHHLSKNSLFFS